MINMINKQQKSTQVNEIDIIVFAIMQLTNQLYLFYYLFQQMKSLSKESIKKPFLLTSSYNSQLIMFATNNPSYYRAHQYLNQFDLPNSAFKNRDIQLSPSSIPQGKEYFQPSSKRHFVNKFNRSEIQNYNVMMGQLTQEDVRNSRLASQPMYFRSLNVGDIEGTQPNTLISKAVKNRQKAEILSKKQTQQINWQSKPLLLFGNESHLIKSRHGQYNFPQGSYSQDKPSSINKQTQAENRFNKSKSILQNSSINVLRNFGSKDNDNYQPQIMNVKTLGDDVSGQQQGGLSSIGGDVGNFHFRGQSKAVNSVNLQKNYGGLKVEQEGENSSLKRKVPNLRQERVYEIQNHMIQNTKNIKSEREKQDFALPSRRFDPQYANLPLKSQNYEPSHQQDIIARNPTVLQPSVKSSGSRIDYFSWQHQKASRMHTQDQNPLQSMNKVSNTPQIDKSNFRMFNPTYLSYQSQAIVRKNK